MALGAIIFGLGSTVIGYCTWRSGSRASSLIRGTATSKIASAAKGFAEVQGRADAPATGPLRDPITHQPCVWFSVVTEKFSFWEKCQWKSVKSAHSKSPFVIDDGTGRCMVYPFEVEIDRRKESTIIKDRWNLRHRVWWIRPGDAVFAIGYLRRVSGPEPRAEPESPFGFVRPAAARATDERELDLRATAILRGWKRDPKRLLQIFDTNGDGRIDSGEWEAARLAAHDEASGSSSVWTRSKPVTSPPAPAPDADASPLEPDITHRLVKPPDGRPFLLTTHGEASLVSSSRARALGGLFFFVIGVLTLVGLLHQCVGG